MSLLQFLIQIRTLVLICIYISCIYVDLLCQTTISFQQDNISYSLSSKTEKLESFKRFKVLHNSFQHLHKQDRIEFEFENEQTFIIEIQSTEVISSDHTIQLSTAHTNETIQVELDQPIYVHKGIVNSKIDSKVLFVQTDTGIEGFFETGSTTYYLEKSIGETDVRSSEYILYTSEDVKDKSIHCLVNEKRNLHNLGKKTHNTECISIDFAIAVDFSYYQKYNKNITDVVARTITVLNASAYDYGTVFNDSITFRISEHFISTCEDCDPWGGTNDAVLLLDNFGHWAEEDGFTKDYDLGQLWTGSDLQVDQNSNTIGYAFKGGLCSEKRYHVLEDYNETLWKVRFLTSHEIGHNLNCNHDPVGSSSIMSPTIVNSNTWSAESISDVNSFVNGISCLSVCNQNSCPLLTGFSIDNYTSSLLDISWINVDSTRIILYREDNKEVITELTTDQQNVTIQHSFSNCDKYILRLNSICGGLESAVVSINLDSPEELYTTILDIAIWDCIPGNSSSYNLNILLEHNGIVGDPFYIDILGQTTGFQYSSSPQVVQLNASQINTAEQEFPIDLFTILHSAIYCLDNMTFYDRPNETCDLIVTETFDNCALPFDWYITSSNPDYFSFPYSWKFDNNSRKILNYGKSDNATKDKTINGSCMAYFDDDILSGINYTGNVIMYTEEYNLTEYHNIELIFSYIFHDFSDIKASNSSYFSLQVWDGLSWINVLQDNEILCPWSDIWNAQCSKIFSINLDQYSHDSFQCRFIYSDGNEGDWTGMIALDNFKLTGDRILNYGCTNQTALNYDSTAIIDNGSCYSCENGIKDGQEIGIDCGGNDCNPCIIPCDQAELYITEVHTDATFLDVDNVYISASIDQVQVSLKPALSANLEFGFEVKMGAVFEATISNCEE